MVGITLSEAIVQIQALSNSQITVQAIKDIVATVDASVAEGKTAIFNKNIGEQI